MNISGVALAKYAPNKANAVKLIAFMARRRRRSASIADANYEYPIRAGIAVNPTIAALGQLKADRCRSPRSPRTARRPASWSTRSGSTTERRNVVKHLPPRCRAPPGERVIAHRFRRLRRGAGVTASLRRAVIAAAWRRPPPGRRALSPRSSRWQATGSDLWRICTNTCCPEPCSTRRCCSRRRRLSLAIGIGAAWLVTRLFPGRRILAVALPLPLAMPTYIVAYVYVELFEPLGPVQSTLARLASAAGRGAYWFPNLRSLPGAIIVIGSCSIPTSICRRGRCSSARARSSLEAARDARRRPLEHLLRGSPCRWRARRWRSALSLVLLETLNDIGASEYLGVRTLTVSVYTTWLNRGSLAGAAQIVLLHAGDRGLPDRDRALRPPQCHDGIFRRKPAADAANHAHGHPRRVRVRGMRAAGPALGFLVPLLYLAHQSFKRGLFANFDMALWRDAFNSVAFASIATLVALLLGFATILAWRWRPTALRFVAMNIAQTGYTLPGLVLALGLLAPLLAIDNGLNALAGGSDVRCRDWS